MWKEKEDRKPKPRKGYMFMLFFIESKAKKQDKETKRQKQGSKFWLKAIWAQASGGGF